VVTERQYKNASTTSATAKAVHLAVPAVGHEDRMWIVDPEGPYSRAERSRGSGPYKSTVPTKIAEYSPQIPTSLAADLDDATQALITFDAHAAVTLGPDNAALGPMSAILLRTESATSSQIENLTAGARQLALAELNESQSQNAKLIVANVRALEAALSLADQLDEKSILTMHRELMVNQPAWEPYAGVYRDQLVWVGGERSSPRGAKHIGSQSNLVKPAMRDLMGFIDREDLPVLAQTAVAHAQFETIHPFVDGNGRTGRALVQAMLRGKGLVTHAIAPISAGLLRDTDRYFGALTAYRAGDAAPIIERFSAASRYAAVSGKALVNNLAAEQESARQRLGSLRKHAGAWKVLPHLIAQPVVNAAYLQTELGMNAMSAGRALGQLTDAGVLRESTGLQRNRVWQQPQILGILDEYAASIRRG
jgi:Fic family protein